jgi:hypothetical protein
VSRAPIAIGGGLVACGVAIGIALLAGGDDDRATERARVREMRQLRARLDAALEAAQPSLERQGIYEAVTVRVARSSGDQPCVVVGMLNPTEPNVAYVRRRFGPQICNKRVVAGYLHGTACTAAIHWPVVPSRPVAVHATDRRVVAGR